MRQRSLGATAVVARGGGGRGEQQRQRERNPRSVAREKKRSEERNGSVGSGLKEKKIEVSYGGNTTVNRANDRKNSYTGSGKLGKPHEVGVH